MQLLVRVPAAKVIEGKLGRQPDLLSGEWVEEVDLHVLSHGYHPSVVRTADAPLSGLWEGKSEGAACGDVEELSGVVVGTVGLGEHELW